MSLLKELTEIEAENEQLREDIGEMKLELARRLVPGWTDSVQEGTTRDLPEWVKLLALLDERLK